MLGRLRLWAGNPSYRALAKRVGPVLRPPRPVSHTTLADAFQPDRRRLDVELVLAVVRALGGDEADVGEWRAAWFRVHAATRKEEAVVQQLPADLATFTGREAVLAGLVAWSGADDGGEPGGARTVVISAIDGMAGVGKSALAVRAAHLLSDRFPDGQLFLDLHGFTQGMVPRDPADALGFLLSSLGVPPKKIPAELDGRAAVYRARLAGTRTLIVLDNAGSEAQVRPLIPGTGGCLVLITSRKRLKGLDEARSVTLDVLPEGEAVALLRALVGATSGPAADSEWRRIAELCGFLPLALRIAAALIRHRPAWTLGYLADKLRAAPLDLGPFTDGERELSAVFELSYRNLAADRAELLRRLGLAPGPHIDVFAAAALLDAGPARTEPLLQDLVDHHLLSEPAAGRYRMHDLIRAYAHMQALALDSEADRDRALDRLLHYYAHTAQAVSHAITRFPRPEPSGPAPAHAPDLNDPAAARAWLRTEQPNLDAALAYARTRHLDGHVVALAAGLAELLHSYGPWARSLDVHHAAIEAAERLGRSAAHATALTDLGRVKYQTGDYSAAGDAFTRALEIQRGIGNRVGEAIALTEVGRVRLQIGDNAGAADAHTEALAAYRETGHRVGEAHALAALGRARDRAGDYPGAEDAYMRALDAYREIGSRDGEAYALTTVGRARHMTGDYPGAGEVLTQALEIYREIGNRAGEAHALLDLGRLRSQTGDHPTARALLTQALETFRETGGRNGEAFTLTELGRVRSEGGDHSEAGAIHTEALAIYRETGHRNGEGTALSELGRVRHQTGDHAGAIEAFTRAVEIFRETGARGNEAWVLNHYAAAIAAAGDRSKALALYQQALEMNRELNKPDDEALALEGIADHHLAAGDVRQGTTHLRQALEIFQRIGMGADARRVRSRLARLGGDR